MPPRTRKTGKPKIAFLLSEQKFRRLVELIQELTNPHDLEYTIRLSDDSSLTCSSANEALGIQNSRDRQITSIWIDTSYHSDPRIEVKFQSQPYLDPIEYEVSGSEKDVFHASARLDEYFSGLRQWYSPVVSAGLKIFWVYILMVLPLGIFLSLWLRNLLGIEFSDQDNQSTGDDEASLRGLILVSLWILLPAVAAWVFLSSIDRLRRWLFPSGTFAIGDGVSRHNSIAAIRRVIGGSVILALIISVLGSWIYSQL